MQGILLVIHLDKKRIKRNKGIKFIIKIRCPMRIVWMRSRILI